MRLRISGLLYETFSDRVPERLSDNWSMRKNYKRSFLGCFLTESNSSSSYPRYQRGLNTTQRGEVVTRNSHVKVNQIDGTRYFCTFKCPFKLYVFY